MTKLGAAAIPGARQQQMLRLGVCALLAVAAVSGTAYRLVALNRCAMDQDLLELLLYSTEQLQTQNIPFWLEFGTLLGAVRDKAIVPWEFDVDLAVTEQQCERVLQLRDKFARDKGYRMYGRGEFIPEKASLFGLVGGTISAPCVRVYSRDGTLPLDVYWSKVLTLTPDHTAADGRKYIAPPDRSGDLITTAGVPAAAAAAADTGSSVAAALNTALNTKSRASAGAGAGATASVSARSGSADAGESDQIVCDHEAFTSDLGDHTSPCRWYTDVFPLTTTTMYGRSFPVPRRARKVLTQTYGPNWMTPKPKGYKALLCPPVWHTGSGTVYAVACAGALALGLALFVYLRASYALALSHAAAAAGLAGSDAVAADGKSVGSKEVAAVAVAGPGGDAAAAGCCDRAFQRLFRWTGVGAPMAPALMAADAEDDSLDATDPYAPDPSDRDQKRLHSV